MRRSSGQPCVLLTGFAVCLSCLFFWMSWRSVTTPGPIWFEGPVAGVMKAIESGRLYSPDAVEQPAYSILTHTPLSYWLGYLVWRSEPELSALRLLNIVLTLGCAALIFLMVHRGRCYKAATGGSSWAIPAAAASCFLLCQPVFSWSQLARSPDSLEALFALSALFVAWRNDSWKGDAGKLASWRSHFAISILIAAAVLSKQTALITLSLTYLWHYAATRDWRTAGIRLFGVSAVLLPAIAFLQWHSAGGFWLNTVTSNLMQQDWARAVVKVLLPLGPFWIWTVVVWRYGRTYVAASSSALLYRWFVVSFLVGFLTCFKDGSDAMYFFDFSAAASLVFGLAMQRMPAVRQRTFAAGVAAATLVMAIAGDLPYFSRNSNAVRRQHRVMSAALAQLPGEILTDEVSFPIAAGRRWWWDDPLILRELERQGRWSSQPILRRMKDKEFSGVLVRQLDYWPDSLRTQLAVSYHAGPAFPTRDLVYVLYLPNR